MSILYTIGHSTRGLDQLIGLLQEHDINLLIDVRAVPRSRHNPQFNAEMLEIALPAAEIAYAGDKALGGMRSAGPVPSPNLFWKPGGFRNFADYAMTPPFRAALARLAARSQERRLAIMCAEAHWSHCHRRIIADYLLGGGHDVTHILAPGESEPARMTETAVRGADGTFTYPRDPAAPELPGL